MATFAARPQPARRTTTHEGAPAWKPPTHLELLFTAATTFVGEDSFYEAATDRETRLVRLVHETTAKNPAAVVETARRLRSEYKIRSASIIVAAEYVAAGGDGGRKVVESVLQRADEPAEMAAYWLSRHGRTMPKPVKRGIADAVTRLYTERNILKYNSRARSVRAADVVELAHPAPRGGWQSKLFRYLLDDRHHGDASTEGLDMLTAHAMLAALPEEERRSYLAEHGPGALAEAGFTWERLSSWLPGGMDAQAWEAVIPNMGVMALVRNLRNFDQAGISPEARERVIAKITNPEDVAGSRIFPYQVLSAYLQAPSDYYKVPLQTTLEHTIGNVPRFDRCLILVDVSYSMTGGTVSARSRVTPAEIANLMGVVLHAASTNSDLVLFASESAKVEPVKGASILGQVRDISAGSGRLGGGTRAGAAIAHWHNPERHDRVMIFTDGQWHDQAPSGVGQIVTFDLAGYGRQPVWGPGHLTVTGYSDTLLKLVADVTAAAA